MGRPPPIPGDRHRGGIEHDEPIDGRSVAWPSGQEPPVKFRPLQMLVSFEQPLGDPMPGIGVEIPEGRLGHAVAEIPAPPSEYRVEASEQISKAVMLCFVRQRPHFRRNGKQRFLRRVGVDGELVAALLLVPQDG